MPAWLRVTRTSEVAVELTAVVSVVRRGAKAVVPVPAANQPVA